MIDVLAVSVRISRLRILESPTGEIYARLPGRENSKENRKIGSLRTTPEPAQLAR
jgi:hypothetical protein